MTKVLLTGGAGFIGSHIADCLVDAGYDVTSVDNLTDQVHDEKPDYLNDEVEYVWGDIRNRELMRDLLAETDVLCHQASAVGVGQSMYQIERYVDVNTLGTARLLDIVVDEEIDLEKMVVASSMSIYGEGRYRCPECAAVRHPSLRSDEQLEAGEWDHYCKTCGSTLEPEPTPESKPLDASSVYAITKKDQEQLCMSIGRAYDIPTTALRYFNTYGPRQALDNPYTGVCAIFSSRIKNGNPPLIYEDSDQLRDFVHVEDIARANKLAIEEPSADYEAINIGSGTPRTIYDIAETLIDLYGRDDLSPDVTGDYRQGDIRHCYADTARASDLLGFEPEVSFEEGMRELVEWSRDQQAEDNFEDAQGELSEKGLIEDS
jgi:dTDP-L-rhamnose 4-epimerase